MTEIAQDRVRISQRAKIKRIFQKICLIYRRKSDTDVRQTMTLANIRVHFVYADNCLDLCQKLKL